MLQRVRMSRQRRRYVCQSLWRMLHQDAVLPESVLRTFTLVAPPSVAAAAAAVLLVKYGPGFRPSTDGWHVAQRAADRAGLVLVNASQNTRQSRRRRAGAVIPAGFRFGIDADAAEWEGAAADRLRDYTDGKAVAVNPNAVRFARFGRYYDQRRAEHANAAARRSARRWRNDQRRRMRAMEKISAAFQGSAVGQSLSPYAAYLGKTAAERDANGVKHAQRVLDRFLAKLRGVSPEIAAALSALGSAEPSAATA